MIESSTTAPSPTTAHQKTSWANDDFNSKPLSNGSLGTKPTRSQKVASTDDEVATIPLFPLATSTTVHSPDDTIEQLEQKLFRFDPAHERRTTQATTNAGAAANTPTVNSSTNQTGEQSPTGGKQPLAAITTSLPSTSLPSTTQRRPKNKPAAHDNPLANADSPRVTMSIGLFFAGQSLVVWSFFTGNVLGLAAGMVIAISAVGVGYLHLASQTSAFGTNQKSPQGARTETTNPPPPSAPNDGQPQSHIPRPQNLRKRARPKIHTTT